jgi:DNA-binding NarL/FixJ family response regulator
MGARGHHGPMDASVGEREGPIRVLIADDSAMLVDTLVAALAGHPVLQVVATARDGASALAAVVGARPDVVLMDLRLGGDWGLDLVPAIATRERPPGVVVFSAASDEATQDAVRRVGVKAQLDKGAPLEEVFDTLVAAAPPRGGATSQS